MSTFELAMLICFGISWPVSVLKSLWTRSTKGKSLMFMVIILVGYIFGILHKIIHSFDIVIYAYIFNFIMVGVDIGLYFRNRTFEKAQKNNVE